MADDKQNLQPRRVDTKTATPRLGDVELRYLKWDDQILLIQLLKEAKDSREYILRILYNQLIFPLISPEDFSHLSDEDLRMIGRAFISNEQKTFKYFNETNDAEFFDNFKQAVQDQIDEFNEKFREMIKPMAGDLTAGAVGFLGLIATGIEFLNKAKDHLIPVLESWAEVIQKDEHGIFKALEEYSKAVERQNSIAKQIAAETLKRYRWPLGPSLPPNLISQAVEVSKLPHNQREAMDELFVDYFSSENFEKLEEMVNKWENNPRFKKRMPIFKDCVSVIKLQEHLNHPANVVLPNLMAQIDGVLTQFRRERGLNRAALEKGLETAALQEKVLELSFVEIANYVIFDILFQKAWTGKPLETPFLLSRHKTLHGEYVEYGNIEDMLRAFLILDFLAALK